MATSEEVERGAREGAQRAGGVDAVRRLLATEKIGVLSTLSLRRPGWPYGTLVPYAVSGRGEPLFLLSALAQHTRNVRADPRATLLVHDAARALRDPRVATRATFTGHVLPVGPEEEPDARRRYLERHPDARALLGLDFALYVLVLDEVQLVAGFGAAAFFAGAEVVRAPPA